LGRFYLRISLFVVFGCFAIFSLLYISLTHFEAVDMAGFLPRFGALRLQTCIEH